LCFLVIWHFENLAASRDALAEIGATPTAQPPNHKDKWVPRRIVPAAQKYAHIRVNSSEAVTWNEKGNL
jgi:hypothetical protein